MEESGQLHPHGWSPRFPFDRRLGARLTTVWRNETHISLKIDGGVAFVSGVQYIKSIKDTEGSMLVSAHASTAYAV